jgi:small subunit ribosomal protein S9
MSEQSVDVGPGLFWGTGRRKTAVARVRLVRGDGQFELNDRKLDAYFASVRQREAATAPLRLTKMQGKFNVLVSVTGGGPCGQAEAVRLGVARALCKAVPAAEAALRDAGYLTRDPREVERKKPGRPGARRRFQFSKR